LQPSLSTPPSRSILQSVLTAPIPRSVPCFSNLREPLFFPFSWPRDTNPSFWTSNPSSSTASETPLPRSRSLIIPARTSSNLPSTSTDPATHPGVSVTPERSPRAVNISIPRETTLTLVSESRATSDSVTPLNSSSESLQISRVENPNFSPPMEVVEMSPQPSPDTDVLTLETTEISLPLSRSHSVNESTH